jgi:hypothetical protein
MKEVFPSKFCLPVPKNSSLNGKRIKIFGVNQTFPDNILTCVPSEGRQGGKEIPSGIV